MKMWLCLMTLAIGAISARAQTSLSARDIAAGRNHTCAVTKNKEVYCWGDGSFGQLGIGNRSSYAHPRKVNALESVEEVVAGDFHTCALTTAGKVFCWGSFEKKSFVDLAPNDRDDADRLTPQRVDAPLAQKIGAGRRFACSIARDESLHCWGNPRAPLGFADPPESPLTAKRLPGMSNVRSLALGYEHGCAVDRQDQLFCWGSNSNFQLAQWKQCESSGGRTFPCPDGLSQKTPQNITEAVGGSVGRIFAGGYNNCALRKDGKFRCWGSNYWHQIPESWITKQYRPIAPHPELSEGISHATLSQGLLCVHHEAKTRCSGDRILGQTGVGETGGWFTSERRQSEANTGQRQREPLVVQGLAPSVQDLAAGQKHVCALLEDQTVRCWGYGAFGQLGQGSASSKSTAGEPVVLPR